MAQIVEGPWHAQPGRLLRGRPQLRLRPYTAEERLFSALQMPMGAWIVSSTGTSAEFCTHQSKQL